MNTILNDPVLKKIPENNLIISVVAYFLSEYDNQAVKDLGFKTSAEAYRVISSLFGKPADNGYIYRRRSEFTALPSSKSSKRGLVNKKPIPSVLRMAELLKPYSYENLLEMIKKVISEKQEEKLSIVQETDEDEKRLQKIINSAEHPIPIGAIHKGEKKPAPAPTESNGKKYYRHIADVSEHALSYANFKCEINADHPTFIRRKTNQPYTEAHHLIPMANQGDFDASLDVEENVVSLCSNCHNQIHYGKDAAKLITDLYEKRKAELKTVGINITLQELLNLY